MHTERTAVNVSRTTMAVSVFLLLVLLGAFLLADDATHPEVSCDACQVVAVNSTKPLTGFKWLYSNSENALHTVYFTCKQQGKVAVNDPGMPGLSRPKAGQQAQVLRRSYRFLPQQWRITFH